MKKRSFVAILLILSVVLVLSLTACSGMFGNSEPSRYYIDIGQVDDARVASIVANNTISSRVRIIANYKKNGIVVATSASSGFIISEDGYVITNRHCVIRYSTTNSDTPQFSSDKPMASDYSVVFVDNKEYSASLVAWSTAADIAVLKIELGNNPLVQKPTFEPLVLETQKELYYGQRVYTIGNPENMGLIFTELTIASPAMRLNKNDDFDSIVLDGNINHGNSGGPILNSYSRVSGLVYARIDGSNKDTYGIGCAIPASEVVSFLDSLQVTINYKTTPDSASSGN